MGNWLTSALQGEISLVTNLSSYKQIHRQQRVKYKVILIAGGKGNVWLKATNIFNYRMIFYEKLTSLTKFGSLNNSGKQSFF